MSGSTPGRPDIPGARLDHVYSVDEAIAGEVTGDRVAVVDCGEADWKCLTTAEGMAAAGHRVSIVSPVPIGAEMDAFSKPPLLRRLRAAGVEFVEGHTAAAIEPGRLRVREGLTGDEHWMDPIDAVVFSWFGVAATELLDELRAIDGLDVRGTGTAWLPDGPSTRSGMVFAWDSRSDREV